MTPTFLSCHVYFVIATVDSPGQVEEGGNTGRRGERREREEGWKVRGKKRGEGDKMER